jgi:hypothetical protein
MDIACYNSVCLSLLTFTQTLKAPPPPDFDRDPQFIRQLMPVLEWFHRYYFRVADPGMGTHSPRGTDAICRLPQWGVGFPRHVYVSL